MWLYLLNILKSHNLRIVFPSTYVDRGTWTMNVIIGDEKREELILTRVIRGLQEGDS